MVVLKECTRFALDLTGGEWESFPWVKVQRSRKTSGCDRRIDIDGFLLSHLWLVIERCR